MTLSTSTVTLAPGSSRTYSLAPGEAVTVATEPNCYVTVTETPSVISSADLDGQTNVRTSILQYKGEWTYGPYALGGTVAVAVSLSKSTSSVSVTLGGNASAVVAKGGSTSARGMILFGDSFQFLSWNIDSTQNKLSSRGIAPVANMLLGNPLKPKINAGLNGDKTSDMIARMAVDVLPYIEPGDVVFLTGGINDLVAGIAADVTVANMQTICDALVLRGAIVSLGTVCPSILRITDSATNLTISAINRGYRQIAIDTQNVYLSDDYAAMLDADEVFAKNIATYSADDLHPNTLGAMAIGRTRAASLAKLGLKKWPLVSSNQDYKGIVYNPLAIGSNANGTNGAVIGTGITGNFCPNGWTSARTGTLTATLSKVARTDGQAGEWVRAAITGGSARDVMRWSWALTTSGVNWAASTAYPISRVRAPTVANGFVYQVVQAGTTASTEPTWPTVAGRLVTDGTVVWACRDLPTAGDQVEASAEFLLSSWTGTAAVQAYINWQNAGAAVIFQQSCNFLFTGDTLPDYTPPFGVLYMPPVTLPAGTVMGTLFVECSTTAGATGNFDLCNVSARLTNR